MKYQLILVEYYTPANGGRPYHSERVVQRFEDQRVAECTANQYNREAVAGQYYSIRKVEN